MYFKETELPQSKLKRTPHWFSMVRMVVGKKLVEEYLDPSWAPTDEVNTDLHMQDNVTRTDHVDSHTQNTHHHLQKLEDYQQRMIIDSETTDSGEQEH